MTDLAGTQLSSLLETLPGIAKVLRSPVADAFINVIRAASGQAPFNVADAEEILRYAVRRNLLAAEESERILVETRQAAAGLPVPKVKQPRPKAAKPVVHAVPKPAARKKPAPKKAAKPARPAARKARPSPPARTARKPAKPARKKK